jgi:ElaB/YqjD/DUF883 family membrane-anchored ribosome-binding protein
METEETMTSEVENSSAEAGGSDDIRGLSEDLNALKKDLAMLRSDFGRLFSNAGSKGVDGLREARDRLRTLAEEIEGRFSKLGGDGRRRVTHATAERINQRIARQTEADVVHYARQLDEIDNRLKELDHEWDTERTLEANASVAVLSSVFLSLFFPLFRFLPAVIAGFLLQHAIQGWCPPVPVIRRLGVRSPAEIERERMALKALRGDFDDVVRDESGEPCAKAEKALKASR